MPDSAKFMRVARHACMSASHVLLFPLYLISGWIPRRKDLWVFGSWGGYRFADNAAAFFLFVVGQPKPSLRPVWISRKRKLVQDLRAKGYTAHLAWSPRGLWSCLRAGVYVFDCFAKDVNFWTSRKARKVNLWSGVPLKTFERDLDKNTNRYYKLFHGSRIERLFFGFLMPWHVDRPGLLICTSPATRGIISSAFDVRPEQIVVTGYPRNDLMLDFAADHGGLEEALPASFVAARRRDRVVFIYLPTFRDSGDGYLQFDWPRLDAFLAEHDATFFYKFHPQDRSRVEGVYDRVLPLPQHIDIYQLLGQTDVLISDYSSIIFDYMLLQRAILCYTPDHDRFLESSRSLNFDFSELGVGAPCTTFDELLARMRQAIHAATSGAPQDAGQRAALLRFHTFTDGASSRRVMEAVEGWLGASDGIPDAGAASVVEARGSGVGKE